MMIYKVRPQAEPLLLHYNIYYGIDLIGEWWRMYFIPAVGAGIIIFNFFLAWFIYVKERILAYFLFFASSIFQVFLLVSAALIILLNY